MSGQNGKGSKPRSGANNSAYWQNYDKIFRRPKGEELTNLAVENNPDRDEPLNQEEESNSLLTFWKTGYIKP